MRLSSEERDFIEKISSISRRPVNIVREVFNALLIASTVEAYSEKDSLVIPYIGSLRMDYEDVLENGKVKKKLVLKATPSDTFVKEVEAIKNGDVTPSQRWVQQKTIDRFAQIIETNSSV